MQTWKPSCFVQDSQAGEGINLTCQAPKPKPPDPEMPGSLPKDAPDDYKDMEEAGGVWMAINNTPAPLEDFDGLEHIFMAKSTKVGDLSLTHPLR